MYKKSDNEQDNTNSNNVRVPIFRKKKVFATIAIATKPAIEKLLMVLTNTAL